MYCSYRYLNYLGIAFVSDACILRGDIFSGFKLYISNRKGGKLSPQTSCFGTTLTQRQLKKSRTLSIILELQDLESNCEGLISPIQVLLRVRTEKGERPGVCRNGPLLRPRPGPAPSGPPRLDRDYIYGYFAWSLRRAAFALFRLS